MEPNLPTGNNVNWALLISVACTLLATVFHYVIPANVQTALVQFIQGVFALGAPASVIVAFFFHNVVNKPATRAAALAYGEKMRQSVANGLGQARKATPALFAILLVPMFLMGCTLFSDVQTWLGGGYSASQTELNAIGAAEIVGNGAQQWIVTNCIQATAPLSFCAGQKSAIKAANDAYVAGLNNLVALVQTQNASAAAVDADIAALAADAAAIAQIEADLNTSAKTAAGRLSAGPPVSVGPMIAQLEAAAGVNGKSEKTKAIDITTIISILETVIPAITTIYSDIQSLIAAGATLSTLEGYLTTAQASGATIDGW